MAADMTRGIAVYDGGSFPLYDPYVWNGSAYVVASEMWAYEPDTWTLVWPAPPDALAGLTVGTPTFHAGSDRWQVPLTWTASARATSYTVERRTNYTGSWGDWSVAVSGLASTAYTVSGVEGQCDNEFRVTPVGSGGSGEAATSAALSTGLQGIISVTLDGEAWNSTVTARTATVVVRPPKIGDLSRSDGVYPVTGVTVAFDATTVNLSATTVMVAADPVPVRVPAWAGTISVPLAAGASKTLTATVTAATGTRQATTTITAPSLSPPPAPTVIVSRFRSGALAIDWQPTATATSYELKFYDQANTLLQTVNTGGTTIDANTLRYTRSGAYTDFQKYKVTIAGVNAAGTGTATDPGQRTKIPNPLNIWPTDSNTWRNGAWRGGTLTAGGITASQLVQGQASGGMNYGCFFYGDQFKDKFGAAALGWEPTPTLVQFWVKRRGGGVIGASLTGVYLHNCGSSSESLNTGLVAGGQRESVARETQKVFTLPNGWVTYLALQSNGWKGIALWAPETDLTVGGETANDYQTHYRHDLDLGFGVTPGFVQITHDG